MRWFLRLVIGTIMLAMFGGCKFTSTGESEYGFRQESTWSFYHETKADKMEASSESSSTVVDRLMFESDEDDKDGTEGGG